MTPVSEILICQNIYDKSGRLEVLANFPAASLTNPKNDSNQSPLKQIENMNNLDNLTIMFYS